MREQWKIFCIALAMLCGEMTMPLMASDDSSVEGDDGAGGDDGGASDDGGAGDDGDAEEEEDADADNDSGAGDDGDAEEEEDADADNDSGAGDDGDAEEEEDADADNNSGAGDDGDAEEDDDAAANDDGGNEVGNNSDDVEEENPLEALGEKLGDDIISGGMDTVSALLDGDVDGATDALLQTGLDVEDDVLDTVGSEMSGKPVVSSSAASRRKTAACGAMADDEDEETQETVFGKATSSASSVGRQAFLRGLDMSEYGKALRDYGTDYPYLLRSTAQASLYAYTNERNARLKGSLEEDGWEVQLIADKWVCFQNGGLNLLAYTGTEDVFGEGGILDQIGMEAGYKNYATGTLKADFKGSLSIGVKQGYADLFDSETGGVSTVSNLMRDADEDESFIFTGHSKGGVFAQIAGVTALGTDARQRASVIAYGVPPIFSSDGASVIDEMSHAFLRVSKENDIVVGYNPEPKSCNGGALYQIKPDKLSIVEEALDEDAPISGKYRTGVTSHSMRGYLTSVYDTNLSSCFY